MDQLLIIHLLDRILLAVRPAIEPRNTINLELVAAKIAVIKKVLSPISDAVIINTEVRKDDKNELFSTLFSISIFICIKIWNEFETNANKHSSMCCYWWLFWLSIINLNIYRSKLWDKLNDMDRSMATSWLPS